ncbi:mechanosensitive ion channel family protein [Thiobacter aerophilum]|uniref:Mechanosensitive ion channel domain-containing protein n=1 Tax=Thiobacter aerophilum TaxID=3121275 RepID=A0ABV0EH76_9BURK
MIRTESVHNLLLEAAADLDKPAMLWQLAVIGLAVGLAWLLGKRLTQRMPLPDPSKPSLHGLRYAFPPLLALLLLLPAKAVLKAWFAPSLINLAIPLLLALTVLRVASQLLRYVFMPSGVLRLVEHIVTWTVLVGLGLHLTGLQQEVLQALDEIGFAIGHQRVSLLLVLQGLLSMAVALLFALYIGRLLANRLMRSKDLDPSLRLVFAKLVRALLVLFAVIIALPLAGIDITFLSVFGGALGVGLGFGLQKIAANYISGFIILLDRSVRIGDLLTINNLYGQVTQISTRYTVLRARDGTEALIPNETLVSSVVVNHSFSDREQRMNLPVQVGYGSDVEKAMAIMIEVARAHPRVLAHREPAAFLREFADNGINLELVVWIGDPEEGQLNLRSELNLGIWKRFQAEGIEIPYPHRDVRILNPS